MRVIKFCFYSKFQYMGFDLLLNESRTIEKDGDRIKLIGVENWGEGRWFPKKGDMDKACEGCSDEEFAILLSKLQIYAQDYGYDAPDMVLEWIWKVNELRNEGFAFSSLSDVENGNHPELDFLKHIREGVEALTGFTFDFSIIP